MLGPGARRLLATVGALALVATGPQSSAATSTGPGAWGPIGGSARDFRTTMQLPGLGYPEARMHSTSYAATTPGGTSTWWGAATPPGQVFGSSQGDPYLNLRPRADDAASPSVTTYTFDRPAPIGWGFVLGDIDSDQVRVTATTTGGAAVDVADLGFRGVFNPCDVSPKPSGCSGPEVKDLPTWDAGTATLTGNPAGDNTYGANGWFVPSVPIRTLTLTFTWRKGLPVYHTWFAARAQDVTGTVAVTTGTCDLTSATVTLRDENGDPLATATPTATGTYGFDAVAATDAFSVTLDPPVGCRTVGADEVDLDLRTADGVGDFSVQQVVTGTTTGEVTDEETGAGVPGAVVTITDPDTSESDTTDTDGRFAIGDLDPGDYDATLDPPPGYTLVGPATRPVTVPAGGGPVDLDFVLRAVAVSTPSAPAPAAGGTTPVTAGVLPDVGAPPSWLPLTGLAMLLAGVGLLVGARRLRRPT